MSESNSKWSGGCEETGYGEGGAPLPLWCCSKEKRAGLALEGLLLSSGVRKNSVDPMSITQCLPVMVPVLCSRLHSKALEIRTLAHLILMGEGVPCGQRLVLGEVGGPYLQKPTHLF